MNLDDEICYCYHVPLRKLINFARMRRLQRASQMSDCLGAGTGCGWCIPILKKIHATCGRPGGEAADREAVPPVEAAAKIELPETADDYASGRQTYIKEKQPKNEF